MAKIVPKNWSKIFNIDTALLKPQAINDMFISFTAYTSPEVSLKNVGKSDVYNTTKVSKVADEYKFFYPKDNITESINHIYGDNSGKLLESISGIRQKIGGLAGSVLQVSSGATKGSLLEEPFIYTKTERRTFSINLSLFAYDDLDADIYDPIKFFRKFSYPTRIKEGEGGTIIGKLPGGIIHPNVFKITGGIFKTNQIEDNFCILNDMNVDYNTDIKFLKEGYPMQANLTLNFTELNQMYADKFDDKKINVRITDVELAQGTGLDDTIFGPTKPPWVESIKTMQNKSTLSRPQIDMPEDTRNIQEKLKDKAVDSVKEIKPKLEEMVKQSPLYRRATHLPETVDSELRGKIDNIIKTSPLYKKVIGITEIDPLHLAEVKGILRKIRGY